MIWITYKTLMDIHFDPLASLRAKDTEVMGNKELAWMPLAENIVNF